MRGLSLFVFSFILVFSLGQRPFLEEQFTKLIPESKSGAYFFALVASTESYQTMAQQMRVLPGVYKVEVLSESQIKDEVKNIIQGLQVGNKDSMIDLNYAGLKVTYTKDLKPRAQDLVRDYLTHLAGEGNITLGAVKSLDASAEKRNQLISMIKDWGYTGLMLMIVIFWTISLVLVREKIAESSYLLESYQRRRKVGIKMATTGLLIFFLISFSGTFILGMPKLFNIALSFMLFIFGILLHTKKYQWEN
jgi:hypothetical protein